MKQLKETFSGRVIGICIDWNISCIFVTVFFSFHCPGESGLGKSTLVDSLFLTDLYDDTAIPKAVGKC